MSGVSSPDGVSDPGFLYSGVSLAGGVSSNNSALLANLLEQSSGVTVADYDASLGVTGTLNASAWANQLGIAGPLLQATGAAQPQIVGDGSLLFNGTSHFMKAAPFTFNQPETIYLVGKQVTWTINEIIYDGEVSASMYLYQSATTPGIRLQVGTDTTQNNNWTLDTYGVVVSVFNGASSSISVNGGALATGTLGAGNGGGFSIGARPSGGGSSNIQVKRIILRAAADSAATQARIQALLKSIYGTP